MNREQLRDVGARATAPLRAVPVVVWLITVLHVTVMLAQTAVFPNVRSPDELKHVDLIVQVEQGQAWPWPDPGTIFVADGVNAGHFLFGDRLYSGQQFLADRVEGIHPDGKEPAPPRGERPSFVDGGGLAHWKPERADGTVAPVPDQLVQHPPLYYLLGAAALHAIPDWTTAPMDQVWLSLRWLNALLAAPIPLLLWASARRLGLPGPLPVAAALAPVAVPEMEHLSSAVNNDNLLVLLGTALTYLLVRVMTGDLSRRTALVVGTVAAAALLTKGFALMFPAWIALAYGVAAYRSRDRRRAAIGSLAVAAVATLPGVAWWVRNLVLYGAIQPHGSKTEVPDLTPVYGWSDGGGRWLGHMLERFVTTFFVQDHAVAEAHDASWWAARVALALVVAGVAVALVRRTVPRATAVVLLAAVPMLGAIVARGSWEQFAAFQDFSAAQQGRYLYAGFAGVVLVAVAGAIALRPAWRRWVPAGVLVLALGLHAAFQYDTWVLYWLPEHGSGWSALVSAVSAVTYWYPWQPWVLVAIVTAGAAAAAGVTWRVVRPPAVVPAAADSTRPAAGVPHA
ncbi:glycosyltransferase family 39 protein [Myceligenerans salitolerans]|uniref:Glycosyltransferase RgtA/B/C/D-like domain-containing protein n=1 Tax=Myceligenerans salitolerans TaxID=1230528 RepID=A0ABS3I832_9MICO|nr:glycosyltransferase family 39 protein [Myceligenerans salitolerans]MBO0609161.1 hypothetical protein [Myceligenerans salitolerans]